MSPGLEALRMSPAFDRTSPGLAPVEEHVRGKCKSIVTHAGDAKSSLARDLAGMDSLNTTDPPSSEWEELPAFRQLAEMEASAQSGSMFSTKPVSSARVPKNGPDLKDIDVSSPLSRRSGKQSNPAPKCYAPIPPHIEKAPPVAAPNWYRGYATPPLVRKHYGISNGLPDKQRLVLCSRRTGTLLFPSAVKDEDVIGRRAALPPLLEESMSPRFLTISGGHWELQPACTGPSSAHELRMEHSALRGTKLEKRDRSSGFSARWIGSEGERLGAEVRRPMGQLGTFFFQGGASHSDFLGPPLLHDSADP